MVNTVNRDWNDGQFTAVLSGQEWFTKNDVYSRKNKTIQLEQ
jgi:hypothetical protein